MRGRWGIVWLLLVGGLLSSPLEAQPGSRGPFPDWARESWWMRRNGFEPLWMLRGVSVIDVRTGEVGEPTDVVIRGDIIESIGSAPDLPAAQVVDGKGRFVMPGLFDLHAHVLPPSPRFGTTMKAEDTLLQLVRHGVTTIRLLPLASESGIAWAAQTGTGRLRGPSIVPASTLFEQTAQRTSQGFGTPETAAAWVAREAWLGARWIKVYNSMDEDSLRAIVEAAERHGLKVCGHTADVPPHRAAALGMHCIEHITGIPRSALNPALRPPRFESLAERTAWYWENAEDERLGQLLETLLEHGTSWVPTLVVTEAIAENGSHDGSPAASEDVRHRMTAAVRKGARLAVDYHRRGGKVGLGTDFPVDDVEPGASAIREIELLVELGGATTAEALQIATLGSARVLGFENLVGTVEPGRLAHLLVLKGNPLEDLSHLKSIELVVVDGRRLDLD